MRRSGLKGERSGMALSSASISSALAPPDHAARAFPAASKTFARDDSGRWRIACQPQGRRQIGDPGQRFGRHAFPVPVQELRAQAGRFGGVAQPDKTGQIDQGFMDRAIDLGGVVEDHGGFFIHSLGRQGPATPDIGRGERFAPFRPRFDLDELAKRLHRFLEAPRLQILGPALRQHVWRRDPGGGSLPAFLHVVPSSHTPCFSFLIVKS